MTFVKAAGHSDVGRRRKGNEDSLFLNDDLQLYVVADGMGGHNAGEVASKIVVDTIRDYMIRFKDTGQAEEMVDADLSLSKDANRLNSGVQLANSAVFELSKSKESLKGMGSTVSAVLVTDDNIIVANVGDSPVYLFRIGQVKLLSVMHTVMAEQAALAPEGGRRLGEEYAHVLTRAMGTKPKVQVDVSEHPYCKGDTVLICSDGLSDLVQAQEISAYAMNHKPAKACQELIDLANERGGKDNITVICMRMLKDCKGVSKPAADPAAETQRRPPAVAALAKTQKTTAQKVSKPASAKQKSKGQPEGGYFKLAVEYDTEDESYSGYIQDLSVAGGFIETNNAFSVGQELMLAFTLEGQTMMINGIVAKRQSKGIYVRFENLTANQKNKIAYV